MDLRNARRRDAMPEVSPHIASARREFAAAMRRGDATAVAETYSLDATLIAPAADVLYGRTAIEAFWRTGLETGVHDVELEAIDVRQQGDVAVEVGRYALHVTQERGAAVVDRGRYLLVHRVSADGRWRRTAEMFSPDAPSPTEAA
jgi:uncharacterized protein (TIGR02246 family)